MSQPEAARHPTRRRPTSFGRLPISATAPPLPLSAAGLPPGFRSSRCSGEATAPGARLATAAVGALASWRDEPSSALRDLLVRERCPPLFLAVMTGGALCAKAGRRGWFLGSIVGDCYSVVLGTWSRRYVRELGIAAEQLHRGFEVPETTVCRIVAQPMIPVLLGRSAQ
jgi:hypothetical protein